jgi:hypothetical protein
VATANLRAATRNLLIAAPSLPRSKRVLFSRRGWQRHVGLQKLTLLRGVS